MSAPVGPPPQSPPMEVRSTSPDIRITWSATPLIVPSTSVPLTEIAVLPATSLTLPGLVLAIRPDTKRKDPRRMTAPRAPRPLRGSYSYSSMTRMACSPMAKVVPSRIITCAFTPGRVTISSPGKTRSPTSRRLAPPAGPSIALTSTGPLAAARTPFDAAVSACAPARPPEARTAWIATAGTKRAESHENALPNIAQKAVSMPIAASDPSRRWLAILDFVLCEVTRR